HGPYHPPERWVETFASGERGPWAPRVPGYQRRIDPRTGGVQLDLRPYLDAYDAAIRHVDELVGRLLAAVDLERTIVLIVSDHGETLDEEPRRYFPLDHGGRPYEEQSRAVAVLAAPDLAPRRIAAQVGLVDLAPTLYPLLGVEAPELMDGIDLGPLLRGESDRGKRAEFTTASALDFIMKHSGRQVDESRPVHSVRIDGYKLIVYPGVDGEDFVELYALDTDPGEIEDLAATDPERVTSGLALLDRWDSRRHDARPPIELDPEVRERLESLGYVF
ncbi:MAG: sulfatase-like hydrolase/transferase, partial [Acidobacteriota bacterium]